MFLSETRSAGSWGMYKRAPPSFSVTDHSNRFSDVSDGICVKTSEGPHQYSAQRKMEWKSPSLKPKLEEVEKFDDHLPIKL